MSFLSKIKDIKRLSPDTFLIRIESGEISKQAESGQFVNVRCCDGFDAYLRRPISICSIDRENKTFDIAYQVRGKGTQMLCSFEPGDNIDVIGPLGKGFTISALHKRIAVVGGGIGIFPLLQLIKDHPAQHKTAILGFRTKELVVLEKEFKASSDNLIITTDDGSYGEKGFVTSIIEKCILEEPFDMVYFCGPTIMMKNGIRILEKFGIPCEVSMEQRMGCGIGACLVCACKTNKGDDWDYSHVCKDGPVFNGKDVMFD